jgi:tRNA threonylcarbamoyl adenosine modification protein (Sua5/YciO/YrdC/YwlC family)
MLVKIYPENPNQREVQKVVEVLRNGGVVIYPTDTVYGMGCDINKPKALARVAQLRGIDLHKANFSFICHDLSHISDYSKQLRNDVFKLMKRNLPGPFTFIVEASNNVPKILGSRKKTVGIRVPDNTIIREIVRQLGNPIMSTSIHDEDGVIEYTTDPELIHEKYESLVDLVIDGGYGDNEPSTVVDCTDDEIVIIREGKGVLE